MRKRTKVTGLVSHTTPDGSSYQTALNKCLTGISRTRKAINKAYEVLGEKIRVNDTGYVTVFFCGKPMRLTSEEYNNHWLVAFDK